MINQENFFSRLIQNATSLAVIVVLPFSRQQSIPFVVAWQLALHRFELFSLHMLQHFAIFPVSGYYRGVDVVFAVRYKTSAVLQTLKPRQVK